jgi:hypothetical protein
MTWKKDKQHTMELASVITSQKKKCTFKHNDKLVQKKKTKKNIENNKTTYLLLVQWHMCGDPCSLNV